MHKGSIRYDIVWYVIFGAAKLRSHHRVISGSFSCKKLCWFRYKHSFWECREQHLDNKPKPEPWIVTSQEKQKRYPGMNVKNDGERKRHKSQKSDNWRTWAHVRHGREGIRESSLKNKKQIGGASLTRRAPRGCGESMKIERPRIVSQLPTAIYPLQALGKNCEHAKGYSVSWY